MPLSPQPPARGRGRWWVFEPEVLLLVLLVLAAYFSRADVLPLRGEEPNRAQISLEMAASGDWVVPRQQGEPLGYRPPAQNWVIGLTCLALGDWGWWAVRLPSLVATLMTTLMIYGYARTFLSRVGALAAAAAFATLPEMFQMGRQAETEALIVLLIGGSLLLWHWGMARGWPAAVTWTVGYGFMAAGMLTKGLQAPVYFVGAVVAYLALTRQWRRLFSWAHLLGIVVAAVIVLAWVVPYGRAVGWDKAPGVFFGDTAIRNNTAVTNWQLSKFLTHLVALPPSLYLAALPWSLLLLFLLRRDVRRALADSPGRGHLIFAGVSFAVAFPTCWLPPGGPMRYIAPLYPSLCVIGGAVVDLAVTAGPASPVGRAWRSFLTAVGVLIGGSAAAVVAIHFAGPGVKLLQPLVEPLGLTLAYAVAFGVLAAVVLRQAARPGPRSGRVAVVAIAAFMVVMFTGWMTDTRRRRSVFHADAVAAIKRRIPPGERLVSLNGRIPPPFAYYYGQPLIVPRARRPRPDPGADLTYFCVVARGDRRPDLDFAWEQVGAVSIDRNVQDVPDRTVVVGRRVGPTTGPTTGPTDAGRSAAEPEATD